MVRCETMDDDSVLSRSLAGVRVVSLATNLPGPSAVATLRDLGAAITKIEPPGGDALAAASPGWYAALHRDVTIVHLDCKEPAGRSRCDTLLAQADLLFVASRPASLERLHLDWPRVHADHPQVCMVSIVGERPPHAERPGHDLTYVARQGLVRPPDLPTSLLADLGGAQHAVGVALALLLARAKNGIGSHAYVALAEAAEHFAEPLRYGLTAPRGVLGGAHPGYRCYRVRDGWIAVAALEAAFVQKLARELGDDLVAAFAVDDTRTWEAWGAAHDVPIAAVR